MCKFLSIVTTEGGVFKYADWELRKTNLKESWDSHSKLVEYFKLDDAKTNKYEYNPLTHELVADSIVFEEDETKILERCKALDFGKIVPALVLKPIVNPFTDIKAKKVTKKDIENLRKWSSVWDLVSDSVWYSVSASVWYSVRYSVSDSVRDSVGDSVRYSVMDSVRYSVWDSVRYSVRYSVSDSVSDSVYAYISSFFNLEKWVGFDDLPAYVNPLQSGIDLWNRGFVPSFDGKIWRLHAGKDAKVVFEIKREEIGNE